MFKVKWEPKWLNLVNKKLKRCSISSKTSLWLFIWKWLGSQCSITQLRGGSQMPIQDHFTSDWEIVTWETKRGKGKEHRQHRERRDWRPSSGEVWLSSSAEGRYFIQGPHSFVEFPATALHSDGGAVSGQWYKIMIWNKGFYTNHHSTHNIHFTQLTLKMQSSRALSQRKGHMLVKAWLDDGY